MLKSGLFFKRVLNKCGSESNLTFIDSNLVQSKCAICFVICNTISMCN